MHRGLICQIAIHPTRACIDAFKLWISNKRGSGGFKAPLPLSFFYRVLLDIQVAHFGSVGLDKAAARRNQIAHQHGEGLVGLLGIFQGHLEDGAVGWIEGCIPELFGIHLSQTFIALDRVAATDALARLWVEAGEEFIALGIGIGINALLAVLDQIERRLSDIEVTVGDQRAHITEEEGQQQGANVCAVDVGVGHDNDAMVAQFREIELLTHRSADRGDQSAHLVVREHLIQAAALDVQDEGEHIPVVGDETYAEAIIKFFDERGISYTVWCFDPHWSPALLEDYDFTPSRQGKFFKKVLQRNLRTDN